MSQRCFGDPPETYGHVTLAHNVPATLIGNLAVHKELRAIGSDSDTCNWSISHIKTGCYIREYGTEFQAKFIARLTSDFFDSYPDVINRPDDTPACVAWGKEHAQALRETLKSAEALYDEQYPTPPAENDDEDEF